MSAPNTTPESNQFLGIYRLVPRLHQQSAWTKADEDAVQRHFVRLQEAAKSGEVIVAGRTVEPFDKTIGVLIFEAANLDAAREFMDLDPTVMANVMSYELYPYRVAALR